MNNLELQATANGLFAYIQEKTDNPLDGIAILGLTLLMIYDKGTDGTLSIDRFANDFKLSLIESYQTKSVEGTETRQ